MAPRLLNAIGIASAMGMLLGSACQTADAAVVLAQYTGGDSIGGPFYVGQSLTTTGSGTYGDLAFRFYSDAAMTPSSAGTLYVLNREYLGTPAALSSSTPGFVAASTGVVGGSYVFSAAASLTGGTPYFVYSDTALLIAGSGTNPYAGGQAYGVVTPPNFEAGPTTDFDFQLTSGIVTSPIAQFTGSGSGAGQAYAGQSVTTAAGGPFDHLSFNFFSDEASTMPTATGNLFILTKPYTGLPSDLGMSTAGFLAESTGALGGAYQFAPGVTLQGASQYYFYADTSQTVSATGDEPYAGGIAYVAQPPAVPDFTAYDTNDFNFRLDGVQAKTTGQPVGGGNVPDPETLALLGIGLATAIAASRRRR